MTNKVNERLQDLIKSDLHQVGKDRQIQLKSHKNNTWQLELVALP